MANDRKEVAYWDEQLAKLAHTQYETVGAAATKWLSLEAALIGVFATVTLVGGLTTLDKIDQGWQTPVLGIIIAAAAFGVAGFVALHLASGGLFTSSLRGGATGGDLRDLRQDQAVFRNWALKVGQALTMFALLLFVVDAFIIIGVGPGGELPKYVATFTDKAPAYGKIDVAADGTMSVAGQPLSQGLVSLTPVEANEAKK